MSAIGSHKVMEARRSHQKEIEARPEVVKMRIVETIYDDIERGGLIMDIRDRVRELDIDQRISLYRILMERKTELECEWRRMEEVLTDLALLN